LEIDKAYEVGGVVVAAAWVNNANRAACGSRVGTTGVWIAVAPSAEVGWPLEVPTSTTGVRGVVEAVTNTTNLTLFQFSCL